jgi:uncharacterized membrane protein
LHPLGLANTECRHRPAEPDTGFVSALLALLLAPDQAPPIAFIASVAGPLIGADLLHLRNIEDVPAGVLSIGGAGTFDGIVLSGIIAAYLA